MKSNRDYTGLERTPASMAWLIKVRAARKGRLDKLLALQETLPHQIAQVQQELLAIDAVIPLHVVEVDPTVIVGRQPRQKALASYGQMTKSILRCLKRADGKAVHMLEIAYFFAREAGVDLNQVSHQHLTRCIGLRLTALCNMGLIKRHHPLKTSGVGSWSLAGDQMPDPAGRF
jgi:hypothetical protein